MADMAAPAIPAILARTVDGMPDPVIVLDGRGRVATTNAQAREQFGAWIEGQSYVSVLRQPTLLGPVEEALFRQRSAEVPMLHAAGTGETPFAVHISPIEPDVPGGPPWVLLLFRDQSATQTGESIRRDFVANVSHELKTPLTAVLGFLETLRGPARDDPTARERFTALMTSELRRMDRLVSDLLSLSRLEGQRRRHPRDRVDLAAIAQEAVDVLSGSADAQSVTIETALPDRAIVVGDADQLLQVVTNLLENALKYGGSGGRVTVGIGHMDREPVLRAPAWRLTVRDEGPGVAPEHIPRLTERFYRVDTGRSRTEGGTGLGLAIVKHIVNRHRGRLRFAAAMGQGMTVTVLLPDAGATGGGEPNG